MVNLELHSNPGDDDPWPSDRRVAQEQRLKRTKATRDGAGWLCIAAARAGISVGGYLSDCEAGMDIGVHTLQRRLGNSHFGRVLCAHRVERVARLDVPAGGGRNELDRDLRDVVDDDQLCR